MKAEYEIPETKNGKIAILGSASSSLHLAPFNDESWDFWALSGSRRASVDAYFELHPRKHWRPGTDRFLNGQDAPVFTQKQYSDIPNSIRYPLETVIGKIGCRYFASSIAYMVGLALASKDVKTIGIWGVDMLHDSEYEHQRPNLEYLLGIARGRGINVEIPEQSALVKFNHLYAYEKGPQPVGITEDFLQGRIEHYRSCINQGEKEMQILRDKMSTYDGALQEAQCQLDYLKNFRRGGVIPGGK